MKTKSERGPEQEGTDISCPSWKSEEKEPKKVGQHEQENGEKF
jgi:hypothetical protein